MLGNFSFGQYFKQGAIELAREFMVGRLRLDWERIWVTVHAGDPVFKLGTDEVAIEACGGDRDARGADRHPAARDSENFWSVRRPEARAA